MKEWLDLYQSHRDLRRTDGREIITDLRRLLKKLGELQPSVFNKHIQQRLQPKNNNQNYVREYRLGDGGEYIATWNLSEGDQEKVYLEKALLTVQLLLNAASGYLYMMTLMVEGTKHDGSPWTIAIHLSDDRETGKNPDGDRQGHGAGGHAALHCHVGPTLDDTPKVRVPLPPLSPAALLAWLMTQVVPTSSVEPAPWTDILEALQKTKT